MKSLPQQEKSCIFITKVQNRYEMNDFTEVTADNLRLIRGGRGMNQEEVADLLGLQKHNISKIETGKRALSDSEKKLLDWYFFGTMPPRIVASAEDLRGTLEFDEAEWRIITILATKEGNKTPARWIADRIIGYLDNDPKAQAVRAEQSKPSVSRSA